MSQHHTVSCRPEHCHWGYFDAALPPVVTIASGDTVSIDCVSGGADILPKGDNFEILSDLLAIHDKLEPKLGAHILTGPVAVEGAEPGDVLEIEILNIDFRQNWGYTRIRPLVGTLPEDFPIRKTWHSGIDRQRGVATLPTGHEIDLAPFFGVMGVAPPPVYGACTSIVPREFGGNMDLKELTAGTTLYLPVFAPGALFSCGDGHGVQGDGEVCITALETALAGTFRLKVRKDLHFDLAARRDADAPHHDGLQRRPRRRRQGRAARDDQTDRRENGPRSLRCLYVFEPRGRSARHPARRRQQGHPRDAAEALREGVTRLSHDE